MSTFYLDYEGGNDANDGTSFANRWKTITSGATTARIAPGDTIRVMASLDPTSLGVNGTWTDGPIAGVVPINSSTNASPISVNATAHGYATGDTVAIVGHLTNTKANGVWEVTATDADNFTLTGSTGNGVGGGSGNVQKVTNMRVKLASAVTAAIALLGNQGTKTNWTPSANVTCTITTSDRKEGGECEQVAVGASFTTGLAAFFATGTLDLSGYQQVSFWIKQTAGTLGAASSCSLKLCSDVAGATPVNTVNIPAIAALNQWQAFTVDLAGALGASIKSVALYVNTDNAAQTFLLDNIIACKASSSADSLSLTSLIGKNSGNEPWMAIQSINGTRVMLEGANVGASNSDITLSPSRGYSGTTETVTAYKRETIKTTMVAASGTVVQALQDSGSSGSLIVFSGGWDRTNMSTQTGDTWFDGQNGFGTGLSTNAKTFVSLDKIHLTRYFVGALISGNDATIGAMQVCNTADIGINHTASRLTATTLSAVQTGGSPGIKIGDGSAVTTIARADGNKSAGSAVTVGAGAVVTTITQANNNLTHGITGGIASNIGALTAVGNGGTGYVPGAKSVCGSATLTNNTGASGGIDFAATVGAVIRGGATSGNTKGVNITTGQGFLRNVTVGEGTEVSGFTAFNDGRVYSEKHDAADNHQIFCDGGLISSDSTTRHTASGISWKLAPTSSNRSANYPLNLSLAKVACAANALVTVTGWFRRTNTGLTHRLVCKGGQLAGVAADVSSAMSASANTWEQLTITFTPTEAGVVEITAEAYGGTTFSGYVDDLAISQA